MRQRFLVLAVVGALVATSCGDDDGTTVAPTDPAPTSSTSAPAETDDGPRTVEIRVDGNVDGHNVAFLGYFPREATVRAGDTIDFSFQPGDPHTVAFGAHVDEAFGQIASGEEPTAFGKFPFAFSDDGSSLIYGGALPCYTTTDPPTDGTPCEQVDQPAFDGSATFYNSGLLEPGAEWTMEISADAAPGTYNYLCLLHGPDMSGSVTVVAADGEGMTAAEVEAAADADEAAVGAAALETIGALESGTIPGFDEVFTFDENTIIGGGGVPEPVPVDVLEFYPAEATIEAGGSLTWNMFGFHTISFNATQDATPAIIPGEDGLPVLNELAFAPQGGANGQPPPPEDDGGDGGEGGEGEEPAPFVVPIDGGTYDGAGFFSSGVVVSFPPALMSYEITFSTPGTYPYQCLIHPDMEGSVTVT